ncbi:RdgB/HAM1 family non-canonical purine NTP pyrophosphatase [Candidatus Latescibacterota bacterium]
MIKLVIATTNPGKVAEISALLEKLEHTGIELLSLADFPDMPEIIEDGATFMENALKKARETADYTGLYALADDSGIMVDALDGAPGVMSARFADTNDGRINKMLDLMKDIPEEKRTARFVCALALVKTDGTEWTASNSCEGLITHEPSGSGGFGYDPIFFHPPLGKTFAEIPRNEKNKISHRGKALQTFKNAIISDGIFEN